MAFIVYSKRKKNLIIKYKLYKIQFNRNRLTRGGLERLPLVRMFQEKREHGEFEELKVDLCGQKTENK